MTILDAVLLLIIAGFAFYGLFFGFIRTFGSLLGLIIGLWLAALFYGPAFAFLGDLAFGYEALGKVATFFIIFTLVNRLVVFIFALLDRTFDFFSIIPFLKTINRLAGAVFGLIEGGLLLGFVFYMVQSFPFLYNLFLRFSGDSRITGYILKFVEILRPIFPRLLDQLKQLV